MIHKWLDESRERVLSVVLETGEEVMETLAAVGEEHDLDAAHFTGIGAFSEATLAFYHPGRKDYEELPPEGQVELLSLVGNITRAPDGRKVHAHATVARPDGTIRGGHLISARVRPTLELFVGALPGELVREEDPASGLTLIRG